MESRIYDDITLHRLKSLPKLRIDARSVLEVIDKQHRYGKNLRTYYNHFCNEVFSSAQDCELSPLVSEKSPVDSTACKVEADMQSVAHLTNDHHDRDDIDALVPPSLRQKFDKFFEWLDGPEKPDVSIHFLLFSFLFPL